MVIKLPNFQTSNQPLSFLQSTWSTIIEPFLGNPSNDAHILTGVVLAIGSNTINHLLGRKLIGWRLVRVRALSNIYDTQDANARPALTLVLVSDAAVTVDIEVF